MDNPALKCGEAQGVAVERYVLSLSSLAAHQKQQSEFGNRWVLTSFGLWNNIMKTTALFLGTVLLWIALNRWILPWFGVCTCMSGGCTAESFPSCGSTPPNDGDKDGARSKGNQP